MARVGTTFGQEQTILIVTKTYPTPSKGHVETTCVAAIDSSGALVRVFPVPFRLLDDSQQFKRWQWVTARFTPPPEDLRPESRRIDQDSITLGSIVNTDDGWRNRMDWVEPHILPSFAALDARRKDTGASLGFIRPSKLLSLDITPVPDEEREWSQEDRAKLTRDMSQDTLFADRSVRPRQMLEKLPYRFHYRYQIDTADGPEVSRHLITDWEAGVLYRNCYRSHGDDWQVPFRAKLMDDFSEKDLVFMMGNMHRFANQWLIIGLVYPPKRVQESLEF